MSNAMSAAMRTAHQERCTRARHEAKERVMNTMMDWMSTSPEATYAGHPSRRNEATYAGHPSRRNQATYAGHPSRRADKLA